MIPTDSELEKMLQVGRHAGSQLQNSRELAACLESWGFSDRSAQQAGFADIFAWADNFYSRLQRVERLATEVEASGSKHNSATWDTEHATNKFFLSLSYAFPWMALVALEYLQPNALSVTAEIGSAFGLSLIASLITSGGFIQMISRCGSFYYGLEQPRLARHLCLVLLNLGVTSSLLFGFVGMLLGVYFRLFTGKYLLLAAISFVSLSLLWMLCAILSVQKMGWCVPVVFLFSAVIAALAKNLTQAQNVLLITLWPVTAALCAFGCVLAGFRYSEQIHPPTASGARPRLDVLAISLVPFYLFGTAYFSFLFADRLSAGSAVPWTSGLSFGIDPAYKQGMDLVLLAFLVTAASVEYLGDSLLRFWKKLATELPQARAGELRKNLQKRHSTALRNVALIFVVLSLGTWLVFSFLRGMAPTDRLLQTAAIGGLGYLMLSLALLEILILASVNQISSAWTAVGLGLLVNLVAGYSLSHFWGVQYAAVGLLAGSAVTLFRSNAAVRRILLRPDYHYSVS